MKRKETKIVPLWIMLISMMLLLSACKKEASTELVNELNFSLEGISDLTISYDDENVSFFMSEKDELVVKEYMSKDKDSYHAKVSQDKNHIQISEGEKPVSKRGFVRYIEVYLPVSYSSGLEVTTTDGNIDMSDMELDMDSVRVDTTSGTFQLKRAAAKEIYFSSTSGELKLGEVTASRIKIETTQGNVTCEKADGEVTYISTSGNADFRSASGCGVYKAENSGELSVVYEEVTGDLYFFNKNDDIKVRVPADLSFTFNAGTKNGNIDTDFQSDISVNGDLASGTIGSNPTVTIEVETKNGSIDVRR